MQQDSKDKLHAAAKALHAKQNEVKALAGMIMPIDEEEANEQFANYQVLIAELTYMQAAYNKLRDELVQKAVDAI